MQRILIADDDEFQGTVLRSMLESRGYETEVVTNGLEAVRRLRTGQYDLGLLDYRMPQVNGLAAARLLHDFFSERDCPRLIAVTATAEELCAENRPSEGRWFDAVVSKQLGLPALLSVIDVSLASMEGPAATVILDHRPMIAQQHRTAKPAPHQPAAAEVIQLDDPFALPMRSDGQVLAVSLAAFKAAVGPDWARIALRAMSKAEHIIKRRLVAGDVLSRSGDHSFVIWFNNTDALHNETILTSITREVRLRFLTDYGEDAAPDACTMSSTIGRLLPSRH